MQQIVGVAIIIKENSLICDVKENKWIDFYGKLDEIKKYSIELEWLEDFSILYKGDDGVRYKTIHQVKAKDKHNIADYEDALVKLYYKIVNYKTIEYAYLHVCKSINYNEDEWNDNIKRLVLNCRQIKALQDNIIFYKNNPMKEKEVKKIYTSGRKSDINKLIKEYNEKYFANKKINVSNVDEILTGYYQIYNHK